MKKTLVALGALCVMSAGAQAGEIYGGIGLPGVMLGYAQPLDNGLTLRADVATLGSHDKNGNEDGIDYTGKLKAHRAGVFADWFPLRGGFRLTGGVTFNDIRIALTAAGAGRTIDIGGYDYRLSASDRFDVEVKFPSTTPYIGIGWGHQPTTATGWGFVFDLGASIGKAKVSAAATGPTFDQARQNGRDVNADIDRELAELREGVGKVKFIPQISLGLNYRF